MTFSDRKIHHEPQLGARRDRRFQATDTAAVSGCDDAIAARGWTWNLRGDTVGHETRWEGNGAHMGRRREVVRSATLPPWEAETPLRGVQPLPSGKLKHKCAECKGCPHGKLKRHCAECSPCPHGRVKKNCAECNPCPHGKVKSNCKECNPCPHGKLKSNCADCTSCPHGKLKRNCAECNPCPHGKRKGDCTACRKDSSERYQ